MHTSPSSQDPLGFDDSLRDVLVSLRHILPSQLDYIHEINEKSSTARVWKARLHPPNLNHGPNTGITVAVKRYLIEDETIDGRILRRNWPEVYETFKREFKLLWFVACCSTSLFINSFRSLCALYTLLSNANSLHVVRPLGYYVPDAPPRTPLEAPFIVMEWVEGTTLMEFALRLPNDKLELFILRAAQQIASALCQLHQVNVWHQDIHASNIKVWVRVADD
jgi:serine/threonine protein kinase